MIDTHCHLTDPRLRQQLPAVLARAVDAGVHKMITIGVDLPDSAQCIQLCRQNPAMRCAVGIHPTSVQAPITDADIATLDQLQADPGAVAIGEIGLDYYWVKDPALRQLQQTAFQRQLELAARKSRPVVIHCREAVADCLAILAAFPAIAAVFHCFTGTPAEAKAILDAGYYLGFTGPVTYKKNDDLRLAMKLVPDDRLLLETDSPYMSPEPVRKQKTNEPAFVTHVAACCAAERNVPCQQLQHLIETNSLALFGF